MINSQTFARYAADPAAFRADLLVDVDGNVRRFGDVLDPWQKLDFDALDPALMLCAGCAPAAPKLAKGKKAKAQPVKTRAYLERPRGHSKTTDLAVTCAYALAFGTRPLKGYAYAADSDQAGLLKQAIATLVRLNPWLGTILSVEAKRVVNKANGHKGESGTLTIEASDVGSSYGILPDLIIADELTHWEGDGALWHSLISSAAKRQNCLLVVISNAGFSTDWQWPVREAARTDPAWHFSRLDGPMASWMTEERLAEQRRMLPGIAFARLWLNQWSSGGGDALTEEDIDAAFVDGLLPMTGTETGWKFCGGLDLGLKRDCSAFVVLASEGSSGRIRLAHHKCWKPLPNRKVDFLEVEAHIREMDAKFHMKSVAFDPWNAEHLAARLESDHRARYQVHRSWTNPFMRETPPTATNLRDVCTLLIESFTDRRVQLFPNEVLRNDLVRLRIEEMKSGGCRLVSPRDSNGHGDSATALGLALMAVHEHGIRKTVTVGAFDGKDDGGLGAEWLRRQEAYAREMEFLSQGGNDTNERFLDAFGH